MTLLAAPETQAANHQASGPRYRDMCHWASRVSGAQEASSPFCKKGPKNFCFLACNAYRVRQAYPTRTNGEWNKSLVTENASPAIARHRTLSQPLAANHLMQPRYPLHSPREMTVVFRIAGIALVCGTLFAGSAGAQTPATLNNADYTFIGLTYLGNQFQVDTGKLGETHASAKAVRDYAQLMDTSHVKVENTLVALLGRLHVTQPPASLLAGAYKSLVRMLGTEQGAVFDRDYIKGQIDYQDANDALYRWELQNGSNADLKEYARQTLPKIDDHKRRVEALAGDAGALQVSK